VRSVHALPGRHRDVDMIVQCSRWRAVPGPGRTPFEHKPGPSVRSTCSLDPTAWRWLGWQNYRPTGVALAAVPGLGARPFGNEIVAAGCLRDWLWSLVRLRGDDHKGRQFEINAAWIARDRQNWDMAAIFGRYVPTLLILDRM
jgi:hypothetical protein